MKIMIDTPISPACFVSIVVPVRDEADYLLKTLDSFLNQINLQNKPLDSSTFEIIILANNCQDNSFEIARNWQRRHRRINLHAAEIYLPEECANIGFVRRLLINDAARRLKSNQYRRGIILTTDGDTRVAPDWITQNILEIERGADAVGGRILLESEELAKMDFKTKNFHLLDEEYRLLVADFECFSDDFPPDDYPRHHQHFNGSFAFTTDIYEQIGSLPDVKFLEDVAFYHALLRVDAKFRHSPNVRVYTSARSVGRTECGLSTQISEWQMMAENDAVYSVESAQSIEKRILMRKKLKQLWQRVKKNTFLSFDEILPIAENLCVPPKWLYEKIKEPQTFGYLMEKISDRQIESGEWSAQNPLVRIENAIYDLKRKLENLRPQDKFLNKTV